VEVVVQKKTEPEINLTKGKLSILNKQFGARDCNTHFLYLKEFPIYGSG
jgi:hypothetical protein